jgi:hypothetical protein
MKALKFTKDRREVFLRALADTGISLLPPRSLV